MIQKIKLLGAALVMIMALSSLGSVSFAAPLQMAAPTPALGAFPVAAEIGKQMQELVTGDPNADIEPQETFGTRALGFLLNSGKLLVSETVAFVNNFAALPQLSDWYRQQVENPVAAKQWLATFELFALVILGSFAAGWMMDLFLLPLRKRIYRKNITSAFAKFVAVMTWLVISIIPVIAFIGTALAIVDQSNPSKLSSYLVLTMISALALIRIVRVILRFILFPRAPLLRLVPLLTEQTIYIQNWVTWYSALAIMGYFVADMAKVVKVPLPAISGFRGVLALVIVGMTVAVILQKRAFVSTFVRGDLSAAKPNLTLGESLRLWFARTWHVLAISYLVIGYFVTMLGPQGGFVTMQQGTIGTIVALLAARLVFHLQSRISYSRVNGENVSGIYRPVLKLFIKFAAWVFAAAGIAASWGVDVTAFAMSPWGQRLLGSTFSICSTILGLVLVYELIHRFIERKLNRRDRDGNVIQADARSLTLLPMLRNFAIIVLVIIAGLVMLSELGIDTTPLLAGAGVLGVALGFGSQTLVKDFLTGLFIILENSIAVGDVVKLDANEGKVEGLTIRTVHLRDARGSLHILPFSEISRITNMSKGFAYAVMDIGVDYGSDLDKVMRVMSEVGEDLRKHSAVKNDILDDLEVQGVENLGDSSIVIRCRIKTVGGQQFDVRRAYLLQIVKAFAREDIVIPFPHVVYMQNSKMSGINDEGGEPRT